MYLINGEPLSKKNHPEHWAWLDKKQKEIQLSGKKYYVFSAFQKQSTVRGEDGKMLNVEQNRLVSVESTFYDPECGLDTHDTWSYVQSLSACKPLGDGTYAPRKRTRIIRNRTIFNVKDDIELIVFMKYISKNHYVKEIDEAKISEQRAKIEGLETQAKWFIYNQESPIHPNKTGDDKALRNVAMAWRVPGADILDVYSLMGALWEVVQIGQSTAKGKDGRGYEAFINEMFSYGDSDKRASVILAINRGVLEYKENMWFLNTRGGIKEPMCGVPLAQENVRDEKIVKYVLSDEDVYELVKASLEVPVSTKKPRAELMAEAAKYGWKKGILNIKSNEELQDIADKKLRPDDE